MVVVIKFDEGDKRVGRWFFKGKESWIWKGYVYGIKEVLDRKMYGRRLDREEDDGCS